MATTLGEDVFRVEPTGALTAEALSLRQGDARPLATLQELQAALVTPGPDELLAVDRLELAGLTLLPREPSGPDQADHVVSLGGVNVDGVRVGEAIDVGAVRIEDPVVWIERRDDGQLELASRPEEPRESPDEDATVGADEDAADAPEPPAIAFDSVRITGQPRVVYRDRSVRPPVQLELTALEVELGRVALAEPEQDTPLSLSAALGRYGRLSFQGDIRPLAGRAHVLGDGRISDFDLVKLDGLARRGIGYSVESGTLSADLDVDIRDERLDSLADLTVRRLEIAALRPEEQDEFTADLGVPLGTALTVLEDNDDTIRLKVPLEGTADEFSVGVRDALRQVMQKGLITGLTTAATTYFAPVWPALAARKLFVAASALDFRAVDFAAGRSVLSPAERAYLGEVAQLLERRSKTSISLCGRAVAADRETLFPGAAGELDDVQAEALAALATRRLESVKDTLIANGIEGARLVSCRTEVSGTDGTSPRVDLGA